MEIERDLRDMRPPAHLHVAFEPVRDLVDDLDEEAVAPGLAHAMHDDDALCHDRRSRRSVVSIPRQLIGHFAGVRPSTHRSTFSAELDSLLIGRARFVELAVRHEVLREVRRRGGSEFERVGRAARRWTRSSASA